MSIAYDNSYRTRQSIYGPSPVELVRRRRPIIEAVAGHIATGSSFGVEVAALILHETEGPLLRREARAVAAGIMPLQDTDAGRRDAQLTETALDIIMNSPLG